MEKEHYVYMVIDKETFGIKYIGKGKGKRCFNILSGISSNYQANKAYHTGLTKNCEIFVIYEGLSNSMALDIEKSMIFIMQPEWNRDHKDVQPEVDLRYLEFAGRLLSLVWLFKEGLWIKAENRLEILISLFDLMWCDLEEVQDYIIGNYLNPDVILIGKLVDLWLLCSAESDKYLEEFVL